MTAGTAAAAGARVVVADTAAMTVRNLRRIVRTPRLVAFSVVQPVMFVLLFRYVFGGAIRTPGVDYVDYLLPGVFVQTALFGGASTTVGLAADLQEGVVDRFRALPMARAAVLAGRTLADLARNIVVLGIIVAIGVAVGFRFHGTAAGAVCGLLLITAVGYSFCWIFATIGMLVKDPETAQVAGLLPLFPLVFASSAFVPVASMPGWLQAFARVQPVSVTVNSVRALLSGAPAGDDLWQAWTWTAGIALVFSALAITLYRRV